MNRIVDGIEACKQSNGYLMAYPERDILHFENGAYCRSWVTQGLIEAGIAGNLKAYPLLRGFYDWFNACPYLPELARRGGQDARESSLAPAFIFTPVGKPEDLQVVQRYYQENFWMQQLIDKDVDAIWKYPYDRPHCYLILSLESFLDLYMATGDRQYLDAAVGGWELFNEYYEHIGGSISISELSPYPPKSYLLRSGTGEPVRQFVLGVPEPAVPPASTPKRKIRGRNRKIDLQRSHCQPDCRRQNPLPRPPDRS